MKDRKAYLVDIPSHVESDGRLLVVESNREIPFEIKRLFWVRDVIDGGRRGEHATKKTRLILIAVTGSVDVEVDFGDRKEVFHLDDPCKGLYIDPMIWRTMFNFSSDCVVEAICDRPFEPGNETFDDYDEFLKGLDANA